MLKDQHSSKKLVVLILGIVFLYCLAIFGLQVLQGNTFVENITHRGAQNTTQMKAKAMLETSLGTDSVTNTEFSDAACRSTGSGIYHSVVCSAYFTRSYATSDITSSMNTIKAVLSQKGFQAKPDKYPGDPDCFEGKCSFSMSRSDGKELFVFSGHGVTDGTYTTSYDIYY